MQDITSLVPTICKLMQIDVPDCAKGETIEQVIDATKAAGIEKIEKCLVYAPDAMGTFLYRRNPAIFAEVKKYASLEVPLRTMFPPKTAVCYASMFSGARPDVHGIAYKKKFAMKCQTIFDVLVSAEKKTAIVTVANSSIDIIFRNRKIDYFSENYDQQIIERALELIKADEYDFILAYNQEYDDVLERSTPGSEQAIKAAIRHVESFVKLAEQCQLSWNKYNRLITFAPDHGAHIDTTTGLGRHQDDIPEDMEVTHFYGISKGIKILKWKRC